MTDARPDYSRWSSDFRMEVSVTASLEHIQTFIHPQVIIIDDPSREDAFFVNALRSKAMDLGKAIIELPADATETMMWIARLDSGSLAGWSSDLLELHSLIKTHSMANNLCGHSYTSTFGVVGLSYTAIAIYPGR